jgi:hypothetical protein
MSMSLSTYYYPTMVAKSINKRNPLRGMLYTMLREVLIHVYWYIHIYIYIYIHVYIYLYTCIHMHINIYICIHIYVSINKRNPFRGMLYTMLREILIYVYWYIHIYIYIYICIYIYLYPCIHMHIHIYICIHIYVSINKRNPFRGMLYTMLREVYMYI